jgi:hypothetical protein
MFVPIDGDLGPYFYDVSVSIDQRTPQSILGRDAYGRERFRVPLFPPQGPQQRYFFHRSFSYGAVNAHLLLVSVGYQIVAIDALGRNQDASRNVLWRQELTDELPGVHPYRGVRARPVQLPGQGARYRAEDTQGRPLGLMGPVLENGVTFQRASDLICADPIRGDTLWVRHDIPPGSDLFGDDQVLLCVPPGSNERQVEAIALGPLDGTELGKCQVPLMGHGWKRIATLGRRVLEWNEGDESSSLALTDPWEQRTVWSRTFSGPSESRPAIWLLENRAVGVFQRSGKFVLLNLADGQAQIEQQLLPEPELSGIYLIGSGDQIFLMTHVGQTAGKPNQLVTSVSAGRTVVTGHLYAFDRHTGRSQWPVPAYLEQRGLSLSQPGNIPLLVFVEQVASVQGGNRRVPTTTVLCLDKRTGRPVHEASGLPRLTGGFVVEGDPEQQTVTVSLESMELRFKFLDQPVAPEPPWQGDAEVQTSAGKSKTLRRMLGATARALSKVAEEMQDAELLRAGTLRGNTTDGESVERGVDDDD